MGFIDKGLMRDERIIYEAKLHVIAYLPPVLVGIIGLALCAAGVDLFLPALIIWAFCAIWCVDIHNGQQFILTSKRVIFKKGIIKRKINELMLRKCEGIQVQQSVLGRILNYGTVLVTTGEVTNYYKNIKNPIEFSTRINEQISNLQES